MINKKRMKEKKISNFMWDKVRGFGSERKLNKASESRQNSLTDTKNVSYLVGIIMMSEENENNSFILFINPEFKDLIFQNMNSSFASEVIAKRFVMVRVKKDFFNFIFKNLSQERILFTGLINHSFAGRFDLFNVNHFESSNSSETELNLIEGSFNILFNSSTCSGLGGSSSTGCQSICSQNSQSSSVTSPVCLYLLNISCLSNSINTFPSNFEAALDCNSFGNNICESILINNDKEVYKFFYDEENFKTGGYWEVLNK